MSRLTFIFVLIFLWSPTFGSNNSDEITSHKRTSTKKRGSNEMELVLPSSSFSNKKQKKTHKKTVYFPLRPTEDNQNISPIEPSSMADYLIYLNSRILKISEEDRKKLDPLKLQKLLYYAHGYCLAIFDTPLLNTESNEDNQITSNFHGPFIRSVHNEYSGYTIPQNLVFKDLQVCSKSQENLLKSVCLMFSSRTGKQLEEETHKEGTPWDKVSIGEEIDNLLLKGFFRKPSKLAPYLVEFFKADFDTQFQLKVVDYIREYLSFTCKTDGIICFQDAFKEEGIKEKINSVFTKKSKVIDPIMWENQRATKNVGVYNALMGHLFFPLQFENFSDATFDLYHQEKLMFMLAISSSYGHLLANYHISQSLSLYDPENLKLDINKNQESDSTSESSSELLEKYLDENTKNYITAVFNNSEKKELKGPFYYSGLLCLSSGSALAAQNYFRRGKAKNPLSLLRYVLVLGIKDKNEKDKLFKELEQVKPSLAAFGKARYGTVEEKSELFEKAGKLGFLDGYYSAGIVLQKQNKLQKALECFEKSSPQITTSYDRMIEIKKKKTFAEVRELYITKAEIQGHDYLAYRKLAKLLWEKGKKEEAKKYFRLAKHFGLLALSNYESDVNEKKKLFEEACKESKKLFENFKMALEKNEN